MPSVEEKRDFVIEGKTATLYPDESQNSPLVVLNNYSDDGASVVEAMRSLETPDCNLLVVEDLRWNHDMAPWHCPPLTRDGAPCTGGAQEYLSLLLERIVPHAVELASTPPAYMAIAGCSLAGLFALWSAYQCNAFARVASVSGSLWFPDFAEFATTHGFARTPERLYLSLGKAEARTPNRLLRTVRECTEALAEHYRERGIDVTYELNPGNHFKDAALRTAKGVKAILA